MDRDVDDMMMLGPLRRESAGIRMNEAVQVVSDWERLRQLIMTADALELNHEIRRGSQGGRR